MKRTTIFRWATAGALAVAAAIGFSTWTPGSEAAAEDLPMPGQLEAFYVLDQAPGMAVLDVVSTPETAGHDCMVHVDGVPAASVTLAPGSNLVFVPAAPMSTFIAGGGEIEFRVAGHATEDDPGAW